MAECILAQNLHSVLKDRLDGTEMGGSEIGQERHVARVSYVCGRRYSKEEMDSGDLKEVKVTVRHR